MAGIFKTLGSTFAAVDTIAASGSRRLSVWAAEQESKTKYRHVSAMTRIKREASQELASELKQHDEAMKDPDVAKAYGILNALDKAEAEADAKQ